MLLLVGVSARAMAESAVECGYRVAVVDYFGDLDTGRQCPTLGLKTDLGVRPSADALFAATRGFRFRGVVYASPFENHPHLVKRWEDGGVLVGNTSITLRMVRDHRLVAEALRSVGVKLPATVDPNGSGSGGRVLVGGAGKAWLEKPVRSGGGHGIRFLRDDPEPRPGWVWQEFIEGVPASATFVADGRRAFLLGASRQLVGVPELGAHGFKYAGNIVPLAVPAGMSPLKLWEQLRAAAARLTECFGLRGLNTVDLVVNEEGAYVLEVNPRWSGSVELIERWLGWRLFGLHVRACRGHLPADVEITLPEPPVIGEGVRARFFGKAIVYAPSTGRARATTAELLDELCAQGVADIPRPGVNIGPGQPVCSVFWEDATDQACWRGLVSKASWALQVCWEPDGGGG